MEQYSKRRISAFNHLYAADQYYVDVSLMSMYNMFKLQEPKNTSQILLLKQIERNLLLLLIHIPGHNCIVSVNYWTISIPNVFPIHSTYILVATSQIYNIQAFHKISGMDSRHIYFNYHPEQTGNEIGKTVHDFLYYCANRYTEKLKF